MANVNDIKGAFGDGTNNSDTDYYTLEVTSAANAVPVGWQGQLVRMRPIGGLMYYMFSTAAATVAVPTATASGGAAATNGEYVPDGECLEVLVPNARDGATIYFCRIGGTASTKVCMTKASGVPGNNTINGL